MPQLVFCKRIWSKAKHNAFTDLIFHQGQFYCCFREGVDHAAGNNGQIRVIISKRGTQWKSVALIEKPGIDLRDPMLSIMPDGRWMMNMGGVKWKGEKQVERASYVSFSSDGTVWTSPKKLPYPGEWLWRITWHNGRGYGASYSADGKSKWKLAIAVTTDGIHYRFIKRFRLPHSPNETTIRFMKDDTMVMLVRSKGPHGRIGHSKPPYQKWEWFDTQHRLGGPNFLIVDDKTMWACSRKLVPKGKKEFSMSVVLAKMSLSAYKPVLKLPSSGDCSYAGMVEKEGNIYISYYSSHEGKSRIYFSSIGLV